MGQWTRFALDVSEKRRSCGSSSRTASSDRQGLCPRTGTRAWLARVQRELRPALGGTQKRSPGALPIAPWVTVLLIVTFHPLFGGFHLPEILHAGLRATVGDRDLARRAALAFVNTVVVHARDCLVLLVPVDRDSLQLELHRGPSRKHPLQGRVTLLLPRNYDFASVTDRLTSGRRDWRRRRGWRDRTIAGKGREQNQRVGAHSLLRWEGTWTTRGIPTYRMVPERRIDGGLGSRWSGWCIEAHTAHSDGVENAHKKEAGSRSARGTRSPCGAAGARTPSSNVDSANYSPQSAGRIVRPFGLASPRWDGRPPAVSL